jgi:hypothetical protein
MGQQVFIPNSGGGGGAGSVFLTDVVSDDGATWVDYGFALPGGGGEAFYSTDPFSAVVAFRVVQENVAGGLIPVMSVVDSGLAGGGWQFFINPTSKVSAAVAGQNLIPDVSNLPLGRVFIATLTYDGAAANLYLNGRFMVQTGALMPAVTNPVSIIVGGAGVPVTDFIEYIGFGYSQSLFTAAQVAAIYMASQDAGRVVFPTSTVIETPYAIYNADVGFSNLALWVPEFNVSLGAPSLPAIPSGIATGTLLTAPFHVAHSGWADVPAP